MISAVAVGKENSSRFSIGGSAGSSQTNGFRSQSTSKPSMSTPKASAPLTMASRRLSQGAASASRRVSTSIVEEEKKAPVKTGFTGKPSDRFMKIKSADPFSGGKKHKTNFGYVYAAGGIPCRINHGSVHHKIHWDKQFQEIDYDPLLINCFEGLLETEHPYSFVAYQSSVELLQAPGCSDKTIPLISKLIMPLRSVFLSSDDKLWSRGLEVLKLLAEATGHHIVPHIHILLAQLNKKMTLNKKMRENVMQVLNSIEERGGKEALEVIRSKIPTYTTMYM